MISRSMLLASAAILVPGTPLAAQQMQAPASTAPTTPAPTAQTAAPPAAPATATTAAEPAAQPTDDLGDEEEIVVTGTRARGSVVGDIPPENTLDARDVRATGATNINELLDALAPQIGSVQGRGGEAPVLLLNGQRISSFRELRDIPTEAIQRVEILPEEVALKYGYGADQKVVNIILRQRFRSTTAQIGAGIATEGGYETGNADVTRLLIQRKGRTTLNLHAEGNTLLTENERNIQLDQPQNAGQTAGTPDEQLAARSITGSKSDLRGSATINRNLFSTGSGTINTELEHTGGRSLIGLNPALLDPLARTNDTDSAHVGAVLNDTTKSQWKLTLTGNGDLDRTITHTDQPGAMSLSNRARETTESADLTGTANGNLFKLPAGYATTTLTLGGSTVHLNSVGPQSSASLSRTLGQAGANVDFPISRRGRDFSALGNLTINGNAQVQQLSDFGTLTKFGAGVNWSPADRLNLLASWTREEGPPSINQLGDPVLQTPASRIFDFTTGQTVLVNAITGGNPNLLSDRRHVLKFSGNWQPFPKTDLKFRADYVHQKIDRPIGSITVNSAFEAAFPGRFVRCPASGIEGSGECIPGDLVSVDLRPINVQSSTRDQLRIGFDFTHPLKSHQPSAAVIQQIRSQFGFGQRGSGGAAGPPPGGTPAAAGNGAPPAGATGATPQGDRGGGGGGGFRGGGGRGGRGGGFFGGAGGGQNRGRIMTSVTDTITFVDKVQIAPGIPGLDYLHGDATGSGGGTPRHNVQAQVMYFNNGLGARLGANWRSGTEVSTLNHDNLHFSPVGTFNLSLFANPGDIPEVSVKHPWLRGTQVRLSIDNAFNTHPNVHDATGRVPLNFQPDLLDPIGRTIMISFRKLFVPSPATIRRLFQQERQQGGSATR